MLSKKFYIQHTVDVYVTELEQEKVRVTFHRMTTREKVEIITFKSTAEFLALLNGRKTALEILTKLGEFNQSDAQNLLDFLLTQHLITEQDESADSDSRYVRQIAYLDDMLLDRKGSETQRIVSSKKITILGCGAVTGAIAEILARAGVLNFVLVDDKYFHESNLSRHLFARKSDIGKAKVEVLADYLKKIDPRIEVTVFVEKLLPNSVLSKWITNDTSIVINGCDQPYIGHTSVKLGRYLNGSNIPMYVMGGFDAHLMSSGELVFPPQTPCIDCIQSTFNIALNDWKPVYNKVDSIDELVTGITLEKNPILENGCSVVDNIGGSGGLAMMSGFSACFSSLKIIHFLSEDSKYDYTTYRYEYLPNIGELTSFKLLKQGGCNVCNK